MIVGEFVQLINELENNDEFPLSNDELANKFRQYDGEEYAKALEESSKEEFDSTQEMAAWFDERFGDIQIS